MQPSNTASPSTPGEAEVKKVHDLRKEIARVIRTAHSLGQSRALSLTITKLEEAKMWAGKRLEEMGSVLPAQYRDDAESDTKEAEGDKLAGSSDEQVEKAKADLAKKEAEKNQK